MTGRDLMGAYRRQLGMALPGTIVVAVVLLILGTAIWQYGMADRLQVFRTEKHIKAHYLARSGAEAVADYLLHNQEAAGDFIGYASETFSLDGGEVEVCVYGDHHNEVIIESSGTVADVTETVLLSLNSVGVFDVAAFGNDVVINGVAAEIWGSLIYVDSISGDWESVVHGEVAQDDRVYPDPEFPDDDELTDLGAIKGDFLLETDGRATSVSLSGKDELVVKLGDEGEPSDRILKVDSMECTGQGTVILEGDGRFLLYVTDSFKGGGTFITTTDDAWIIVFLAEDATFDLAGTPEFRGAIYGPKANVDLSGTSV
ncbi:MAG: hypothetical protein R6U70_07225, partial [Bacillota bacterium]